MHQSEQEILLTALGATAEIMGTQLQANALLVMADDLSTYPLSDVLAAIKRCRRELSGRLTLNAIIDRVHSADGMPGAEEAWALMSKPEAETTVITGQMGEAMQVARPVLNEQGHIAARMVFREVYTRVANDAREWNIKPHWFVSLGHDKEGRAGPIADAVRAGKLALEPSLKLLSPEAKVDLLQLTGNLDHPILLEHKQALLEEKKPLDTKTGMRRLAEIKDLLAKKKAAA